MIDDTNIDDPKAKRGGVSGTRKWMGTFMRKDECHI